MLLIVLALISGAIDARAACMIQQTDGSPAAVQHDPLFEILRAQPSCPTDVFEFRALLLHEGFSLRTTMVANRGFHNPSLGSFSLFEMPTREAPTAVPSGHFFFGHFTGAQRGTLAPEQEPTSGALMIELIVWDREKGNFNFYEMIGDGEKGNWFFRGDSADIVRDTKFLHLQSNPERPVFGQSLRCSGCHLAGGPILKELASPQNDWWQPSRRLPFGNLTPTPPLSGMLSTLVPAQELADAVQGGMRLLQQSPQHRDFLGRLSLREQLRPLFCPVEVNFESDTTPLLSNSNVVRVPSGFFADPRLATAPLSTSKVDYQNALTATRSQFPETSNRDADHAWLTPIKAFSDRLAVDTLEQRGVVDQHFSLAVLSVDASNPVTSPRRCALFRFVPESPTPNWQTEFKNLLRGAAGVSAVDAHELLAHLEDPTHTSQWLQARAQAFLERCQARLSREDLTDLIRLLDQRRAEVAASEISRNPRGQILEPGFRVIFPKIQPPARPLGLSLNSNCEVVR